MALTSLPDVWSWITSLPPFTQWKTDTMSISICPTKPTQQSLILSATQSLPNQNPSLSFSISAHLQVPIISLWTSKSLKINSNIQNPILPDHDLALILFYNLITDVLNYTPNKNTASLIKFHKLRPNTNFNDLFNLAFYTLALLICIYEAPQDLRSLCLDALKAHLMSTRSREASKLLMQFLGSTVEEQWMRSLNLAITNWIVESHPSDLSITTPSPSFSYAASSTLGLWKVQLYCPTILMKIEKSAGGSLPDDRLLFSLRYLHLEGVIQLGYKVFFRENWIDVAVNIDNVRLDVIPLASEALMAERGTGTDEKHFPSRISLQLAPILHTSVFSVSLTKSSDNPLSEIGVEKSLEAAFDPPNSYLGLKASVAETRTTTMKPWKFEQSVHGNIANLNWFLHDSLDDREVASSKPPKLALVHPKAWFRDRYSSAYRPFTKEGGVVFAGDEYGERVWWKVSRGCAGKRIEWEMRGLNRAIIDLV
ncbi:hypothetical protein ACLOJK_023275 [Asimina triloba]